MRLGLKSKLILGFSLFALPILLYLFVDYQKDYLLLTDNLLDDQLDSAKAVAALVDAAFEEAKFDAQTLAADPELTSFSPAMAASFLKRSHQFQQKYENLALFDREGNFVASATFEPGMPGPNIGDRDFFQQVLESRAPVISGILQSRISGNPVLIIAAPVITGDGDFLGVHTQVFNANYFLEKLSEFGLAKGHNVLLADKQGILAFMTGKPDLSWEERDASAYGPIKAALEGEIACLRSVVGFTGDERMVAAIPTPKHGWVVAVSRSVTTVEGPAIADLRSDFAANAGIVLFGGMLLLFLFDVMLIRPIRTFRYHLARVGLGDWRAMVNIQTGDEFEELGDVFNETVSLLQQKTAENEALLAESNRAREQMEELARLAERRAAEFESVISSIADGVAVFDENGRQVRVNESVNKIFGVNDTIGQHYSKLVEGAQSRFLTGELVKAEQSALARSLRGEVVTNEEVVAKRPDGTEVYISASTAPIRDSRGHISGCVSVVRDITPHIEAQRAAEEAERKANFLARASAYFTSAREAKEITDFLATRALDVLGNFCAVFLLDEAERTLEMVSVADKSEERKEVLEQVLTAQPLRLGEWSVGKVVETRKPTLIEDVEKEPEKLFPYSREELELARRQGILSMISVPLVARNRVFGGFCICTSRESGLLLDIDDLDFARELGDRAAMAIDNVRLYAELGNQRAFLQTVLDNVPAGIAVIEIEGLRIRQANVAFRRRFLPEPYWKDNVEGLPAIELTLERGWKFDYDFLRTASNAGRSLFVPEFPATDPEGKQTYWAFTGIPFQISAEEEERLLVVAVEVTQTVDARKKVEEVDRQKDEFLSIVSHELRSPLTSAKGYAQMLIRQMSVQPEKAREVQNLQRVVDQVNRMASMIEELLDVSRIQMGRLRLEIRDFDLAELVVDTVERLQVTTNKHDIRLFVPPPLMVKADRNRIEQVVANLVSNAIKYSPRGGEILVQVYRQNGTAEVSVKDHGIGIREEARQHIFEQFYQAGTAKREGGLGLGLYICRGIVEQHGGRIWFESKEGEGSTFHFTIPVVS